MSILRSRVFVSGALIALTLAAVPAHSTIITTYTVQSNWLAALTGQQTDDFSGLPTGTPLSSVSFLSGTVIFTASNNSLQAIDTGPSPYYNFGTGIALSISNDRVSGNPAPTLHIALSPGFTAFGLNLFTGSPNGMSFSVVTAGSTFTAPTFAQPTPAFFGVTSSTPITAIDLTVLGTVFNGGTIGFIDNFSFGTATTETPEIASRLLIGGGLVVLAGLKKRSRAPTNPPV